MVLWIMNGFQSRFLDRSQSGGRLQRLQEGAASVRVGSPSRNGAGVDRGKLNRIGQCSGQFHAFIRNHLAGESDAEFGVAFCDSIGDFRALVAEVSLLLYSLSGARVP